MMPADDDDDVKSRSVLCSQHASASTVAQVKNVYFSLALQGKHFFPGSAQKHAPPLKTCPTGGWDNTCPYVTIEQN